MRKFLLVTAFLVQLGTFNLFAQAPNQFSYQAVIREASGKILESKPVNIRISILKGSTTGNAIFQEDHSESTNVNGLVSLQIGSKVNFNIDWSQGPFFIKTELKNVGEANYVDYGTTQMLSVPYALYAEKSGSSSVPGPKGDKGDKGDTGSQGLPGKDGMNGKDGKVEFQNLRVSATGDTLFLTNGNFVIIPGLSTANPQTKPTSGYGPNITDIEGNSYKTVYIGTQQWMGENLKTSKYNDGTPIQNVTDNTQWTNNTTGAWCYYNNDALNNDKYGKLYNWYAVSPTTNGNKNVCPSGWHVPTDAEWTVLSDYLGGESVAGGKLKEVGTTNWNSPNTGATNNTLFYALPNGGRSESGVSVASGTNCNLWSSSEFDMSNAFGRFLSNSNSDIYRNQILKSYGNAIRCLKDADNSTNLPIQGSIQTIDCGGATNNGTLTANTAVSGVSSVIAYTGGNGASHQGQTISSTGVTGLTATLSAGSFANGNGTLTYNITGTPSSSGTATFGINISGKTCVLSRTIEQPTSGYGPNITDIDGNTYKTVYIGTQQWMGENLKTSKYNDGTPIPNVTDNTEWSNLTTGAWCNNYNSDSLGKIYGKLYNWYPVSQKTNGNKNVCPSGWHMPSDTEWTVLSDYLGGENVAGGKMKEVSSSWNSPNIDATNVSLFTGIPGGGRNYGGHYGGISLGAF